MSRREFLERSAAAAAALVAAPGLLKREVTAAELESWKTALLTEAPPRRYRSDLHADARLHLGGIGTGNFEIGVDGQFSTWQLFNTLRDGEVPFWFALRVGDEVRLLQTVGGPEAPRVQEIEMTGEYPVATLKYLDSRLPVVLELTAFTPFAPLDARLSAVPIAAFVFRVANPGAQAQTVSLAAFLSNPVGYDARGKLGLAGHPDLGGNQNEPFQQGLATGLVLSAKAGTPATLDRTVYLYASSNLAGLSLPPADRPPELKLESADRLVDPALKFSDPAHTILWFEEAAADFPERLLRAARDAVQGGATLVLAGSQMPLLSAYGRASGGEALPASPGRPDVVIETFDDGYGQWTVEGRAFGPGPATGTLPNQQPVTGFVGRGFVNTYFEGDGTVGRLVSRDFGLDRHYLRFLVGGGSQASTQIRLIVGGRVVRTASGRDQEQLLPVTWDVREFAGQTARLEIVDENTGPWGHINVDQIELSDQPANLAVFRLLEELLPLRFTEARPADAGSGGGVSFVQARLRDGARSETSEPGFRLYRHPVGRGQVVVVAGPVLPPDQAASVAARQRAFAGLCGFVGARYQPLDGQSPEAPGFGTLALATLGPGATLTSSSDWELAWHRFRAEGRFQPFADALAQARQLGPSLPGRTLQAAVASTITVPAGGSVEVPFFLAWHYPNKYSSAGQLMGNHYATLWPNARAVVDEAVREWSRWREQTERFRRAMYDSTLPYWLLDCLTANAAIIRHIGVVFRIANGDPYGWEGSNGCCQPTCTHVWGYEQTLARLFPDLERDMRRIDFKHQQREDGGVNNRTDVPSPPRPTGEQPFADGHASCVLKAYREALNAPDETFLREYWPHARRAVEYLIGRDAKTNGGEPAGVLQDDQWNTYDEALHGVTTFIGTYYLAALRAGTEWARRMNDSASAERFQSVFEKGRRRLIELCWNGEYFQQHLPDYLDRAGEVGPGCMSDQLIGQWWAHQLDLGYLLPMEMVQSALRAIVKYNWKTDLTGWKHQPRAFAGARDKGLIICTWPKGGRPNHVMLYSDEVWTGIEYQVAAHLIYEGMVPEGFAIVKGARDRYDGVPRPPIPRNPWNEIECGGHYARAMSSWSLLLALSGWVYDSPRRRLQLQPRWQPEAFRSCFVAPEGWGSVWQQGPPSSAKPGEPASAANAASVLAPSTVGLDVHAGRLSLSELILPGTSAARADQVRVTLAGRSLQPEVSLRPPGLGLRFASTIAVEAGQSFEVKVTATL